MPDASPLTLRVRCGGLRDACLILSARLPVEAWPLVKVGLVGGSSNPRPDNRHLDRFFFSGELEGFVVSEFSWELLWLVTLEVVEEVGDIAGIRVVDEAPE